MIDDQPICNRCNAAKKLVKLREERASPAIRSCERHFPGFDATGDRVAYFHTTEANEELISLWSRIAADPCESVQGKLNKCESPLARTGRVIDNVATAILADAFDDNLVTIELEADSEDAHKRGHLAQLPEFNGGQRYGSQTRAFWESN